MDEEIEAPLDDLEALASDDENDLGDAGTGSRGGGGVAGGGSTGVAQS